MLFKAYLCYLWFLLLRLDSFNMGLHSTFVKAFDTLTHGWFLCFNLKLLVLWFIYFNCYSVLWFVPMFCSLILVVNVMHFFKYFTLVPLLDFLSLMQLPCVGVSVECWTCEWYFALSLLACMFGCSVLVWMIIVVTIYSACSFLVKPCFIAYSFLLDCIVLAPYAFQVFCLQWSYCVVVFRKYLSI